MVEAKAWLYTKAGQTTFRRLDQRHDYLLERGWTETPLYGPEALAAKDARIAELERAVIKAAAPDFLTQAERDALKDFVAFLRSSEGTETRQALETKHG